MINMTLNLILKTMNPTHNKFVHEGLVLGRKLGNHFQRGDINVDRDLKFQRAVNDQLNNMKKSIKI